MRLGLGLDSPPPRGGGSGGGGPPGPSPLAWYDYALTASLFQDAARTTPTTANGQVVQGVADQSGNGRHQANASGVGTRGAAGFAVTGAANGGLLCPSTTFVAGYTVFVICDASSIAGAVGLLVDSRDGGVEYLYRAVPYSRVDANNLGDAAFYTGLAGQRCFAVRVGSAVNASIWRAGASYAAAGSPSGTVADLARVWALGQQATAPFAEAAATTYKGMLLYSGALSDGDMAAVSTWAATRWSL